MACQSRVQGMLASLFAYFQLTTQVFLEPSEYDTSDDHLLFCGLIPVLKEKKRKNAA